LKNRGEKLNECVFGALDVYDRKERSTKKECLNQANHVESAGNHQKWMGGVTLEYYQDGRVTETEVDKFQGDGKRTYWLSEKREC
jgi:hypothetical protein